MPRSTETIVWAGSSAANSPPLMADAVRWGDLLFLSGRAAVEPGTLRLCPGGFEEQANAVLDDVTAVLEAAGSSHDRLLRVECFLADAGDFDAWNQVWRQRFASSPPARTTVVTGFGIEGILIELQVVAGVPS